MLSCHPVALYLGRSSESGWSWQQWWQYQGEDVGGLGESCWLGSRFVFSSAGLRVNTRLIQWCSTVLRLCILSLLLLEADGEASAANSNHTQRRIQVSSLYECAHSRMTHDPPLCQLTNCTFRVGLHKGFYKELLVDHLGDSDGI